MIELATIAAKEIKKYLGDDYEVTASKTEKVGGEKTSITIRKKDENIAPVYHINDLVEQGLGAKDICRNIVGEYRLYYEKPKFATDINKLITREFVRENVYLCLASSVPDKCVSRDFHELKKYMRLVIEEDKDKFFGTIVVGQDLLEKLQLSEDELFEIAEYNTENSIQIRSLMDIVKSYDKDIIANVRDIDEIESPYIIVNNYKQYAAGIIAVKNLGKIIKEKLGYSKFIILPSSVHEFIVVAGTEKDIPVMTGMVKEINHTAVAEHDRLCDHCFYFDGELLRGC